MRLLSGILSTMVTHEVTVKRPAGADADGRPAFTSIATEVQVRLSSATAHQIQEPTPRFEYPVTHSFRCALELGIAAGDLLVITRSRAGNEWTAVTGGAEYRVLSAEEPAGLDGPDHVHGLLSTLGLG